MLQYGIIGKTEVSHFINHFKSLNLLKFNGLFFIIKTMKKIIFTALLFAISFPIYSQKNPASPFLSIGTNGIGFGVNKNKYSIFTRYYYDFYEDFTIHVYTHNISINATKNLIEKNNFNVYLGIGYTTRPYRQKYFFKGTLNTNNYSLRIPLGVDYHIFNTNKFSVLFESGLELQHLSEYVLKLNYGTVDIRYRLSKKH